MRYDGKMYITAFPNPIHLFLSLAIDHYNFSEQIKFVNFPKCGIQYDADPQIKELEKENERLKNLLKNEKGCA